MEQAPQAKKEPRINTVSFALMVCVAILCDLLGPFGAVGAPVIFYIWFTIKHVPILTTKKVGKQLANLGLNGIGEIASAGVWAGITVGVIITIVFSRAEDAGFDLANPVNLSRQVVSRVSSGSAPQQEGSVVPATEERPTERVIRPANDRWSQNAKPVAPKPSVDGLRKAA
ncbi:MAG: hypothetical protein KBD16_00545 [Candidatus Pacebacteria bacterium]|nr:hypothetical protein [Candidatus Paceibacterota bacterium]